MPDEFVPRANSVTSGDQLLAGQAQQMITTFRRDHPAEFREMVTEFDGRDANLAVFGTGRVNVHVANGNVTVQPGLATADLASGAIYMEALQAIKKGVLTPLQAYFRGDIIVRAPENDLHRAYGFFVKFAGIVFASTSMREHFDEFENQFF
jgi:hypothetical protein